jgi:hypothetical protein
MSPSAPQWPNARAPARVELAIGELELIGFPAAHRHAIASAVEASLSELVATRGWPSASEPEARTQAAQAAITLDPQAAPERVGRAIARAIFHAAAAAGTGRPEP